MTNEYFLVSLWWRAQKNLKAERFQVSFLFNNTKDPVVFTQAAMKANDK